MTDRYVDYDRFAEIYNRHWGGFARNVIEPLDLLGLSDLRPGDRLLDVCCGTGQLAAALSERGLQVVGVDGSAAMVALARTNAPGATFVVAEARDFGVDQRVQMAVSTFDSLNHIMTRDGLRQAFDRVAVALEPGGRSVFDLNMEAGYRDRWHGAFVIDQADEFIVAESSYDADEAVGVTKLTVFGRLGDRWQRSEIVLTQRCYSAAEVVTALEEAGFTDIEVRDAADVISGWHVGRSFFSAALPQ